jgi:SAM-dependent methyltransferase
MSGTPPPETWSAGAAYEPYIGRWSRLVAARFIDWLALPPGARWLDVGCGTGALSAAILERAAPARVFGVDPAEGFLAFARAHVGPRAEFVPGDARDLPVAAGGFDAAVSGLVLNFVPDPGRALAEMRRAVRPGGTVAVYVWDYAEGMELIRRFWDAAVALDPAAASLDEARRFPLCHSDTLAARFAEAGLERLEARTIEVPTVFRDFDDYWSPFLGGQGPAPGYAMSLPEDRRDALRERLRAALPPAPDGRLHLTARAFAQRGARPT